jgi:hypothetical protein
VCVAQSVCYMCGCTWCICEVLFCLLCLLGAFSLFNGIFCLFLSVSHLSSMHSLPSLMYVRERERECVCECILPRERDSPASSDVPLINVAAVIFLCVALVSLANCGFSLLGM